MRPASPAYLAYLFLLRQWPFFASCFEVPDSSNLSSWSLPSCFAPCMRTWCGIFLEGADLINNTACICNETVDKVFNDVTNTCLQDKSDCSSREYWSVLLSLPAFSHIYGTLLHAITTSSPVLCRRLTSNPFDLSWVPHCTFTP
uniref:EC21 protein n=1 Tax=Colletotrichum higginsianum TaxID=80884 RepID=I2G794_9PEZI|nr:EC21 protein [Colletotrichum higginsianum]